ncbi:hypothetical protein GYA93_19705 [Gordonia desulfuricans]|uniref:DUF7144 domain-containing protein n=1 Tax=Gordonia desulfuricans TaxID=89051 RepID=A0A7K3LUC8_9ACTN|nr:MULTISPECIES: hypothetical protein [Gordonia]EMP12906.1 membrane protein [Gordonia sp. NB41Y]NDK91779.1 hypothetical protein [Gordonia desulfuricans]WLP92615.1 hypothetical protein Q9K23_10490 [Gordonia sp. NB41Y]
MTTSGSINDGSPSTEQNWAAGLSIVAAVVLLITGILQFFQGISAVRKDTLLVFTGDYVFKFNLTTWGWIHIVVGLIVAVVGLALFFGATWARALAIVVLAISVILNFLWIPYYPWWSIILIILGVIGIWAVAAWNTDEE